MALYYSPVITFNHLNKDPNILAQLFQAWFGLLPQFKNDFDKIRMLFGLSTIFRVPRESLPPIILESASNIFKTLIKLSSEILELREVDEDDSLDKKEEV